MGLMTEAKATRKKCKALEIISAVIGRLNGNPALPVATGTSQDELNICCEGSECVHWNFTTLTSTVEDELLDEGGYIKQEVIEEAGYKTNAEYMKSLIMGYCGFSPPIEELSNLQGRGGI